jgi:Tfp pilus assembly protein PilP
MKREILLTTVLALSIAGCSSHANQARSFIDDHQPLPPTDSVTSALSGVSETTPPVVSAKDKLFRTTRTPGGIVYKVTKNTPPLERYPLDDYSVLGAIRFRGNLAAVLETPSGRAYILPVGGGVSTSHATVVSVTRKRYGPVTVKIKVPWYKKEGGSWVYSQEKMTSGEKGGPRSTEVRPLPDFSAGGVPPLNMFSPSAPINRP